MKTFTFSLVLRTRENIDVFITLDENIFGIHSKRVNIVYILLGNILHRLVNVMYSLVTLQENVQEFDKALLLYIESSSLKMR